MSPPTINKRIDHQGKSGKHVHVQHAAEAVGLMEAVYWLVASVGDAIGGSSALMVWLGCAARTESKVRILPRAG
jgi:hypothetical protein